MRNNNFSIFLIVELVSALFILSSCTTDEFNAEEQKTDNKYAKIQVKGEWDESYHPSTSSRSLNES